MTTFRQGLRLFALSLLLTTSTAIVSADTGDTIAVVSPPTPPTPRISKLSITASAETMDNGSYYVKTNQQRTEEGRMTDYRKAIFRVSAPFLYWKKMLFSAYANYTYVHEQFAPDMRRVDYGLSDRDHHHYTVGLNVMSRTKLWGKTLTWVLIGGVDFSKFGYERTTGMLTAIMNVKESENTKLGVGLIGLYNTFSNVPLIPIVTYQHTFSPKLSLNLTLPRYHLRYTPNRKNAFTVGVGYNSTSVYIEPEEATGYKNCRYTRFSAVPGMTYERTLADGLVLSAEGGLSIPVTNRINEHSNTTRIASVHTKPQPMVKLGITYNLY